MDLSIVIPALDEGKKIARDIAAASDFLTANDLQGEISVVDDGSQDDTTEAARKAPIPQGVKRNVIRCEGHHGKGYAVRTGIIASTGKYVMFADCGLCIAYGNALQGLALLRDDKCDIAHGSRRLIESVRAMAIPHRGSDVCEHVTLSIGISSMHATPETGWDVLYRAADSALYAAKKNGRNRCVLETGLSPEVPMDVNTGVAC